MYAYTRVRVRICVYTDIYCIHTCLYLNKKKNITIKNNNDKNIF